MRTMVTFVAAAAMFACAGIAGATDNTAEERFRLKYGRYTPAEEARQSAVEEARKNALGCGREDCCHKQHAHTTANAAVVSPRSTAEERFRAKWGRTTAAEEARLTDASRTDPMEFASTAAPHAAHVDDVAAKMQEKLGRRPEANGPAPQLLAAAPVKCALACCNRNR
jgi:hypothetical protein